MLQAANLSHIYLKGTPLQRLALTGVSLSVRPGECLAVVGASGSGKSTLARILAGLVAPASGSVLLDGENVAAVPVGGVWKRRLGAVQSGVIRVLATNPMQFFERKHWSVVRAPARTRSTSAGAYRPIMLAFQNPEDQFFTSTVFEEIGIGLAPPSSQNRSDAEQAPHGLIDKLIAMAVHNDVSSPRLIGMANPAIRQAVLQAMRLVELEPAIYGERDPFTLSGGEQRRLALALLLARKPRVLVLDEPSAGLDEPGRQRLYACLERIRDEQRTAVVLVSHDLDEVAAIADRVLVLDGGRVAAHGDTEVVMQDASMLTEAGLAPRSLVQLRRALSERGCAVAPAGDWSGVDGVAMAVQTAARERSREGA